METELKIAEESLNNQFDQEILDLRDYLKDITKEKLLMPEIAAEAAEKIFYAFEGIKKISCVLNYVCAWEENGDPPQFHYTKE